MSAIRRTGREAQARQGGRKFERSENDARRSMATRIASRTGEGTKETNGSETGHDRQAWRRFYGTTCAKECKYNFACPKRGLCDATNSHRVTRAAEIAAVSRADRCLGEADCAGLHPEDVLVYVEWVQGRAIRPHKRGSTVAATSAAF